MGKLEDDNRSSIKYKALIECLLTIDYQGVNFGIKSMEWKPGKLEIVYDITGEDNKSIFVKNHFINKLTNADIELVGTIDYLVSYTLKFNDLYSLVSAISHLINHIEPESLVVWGCNGGMTQTVIPSSIFDGNNISNAISDLKVFDFREDALENFKSLIVPKYLTDFEPFFNVCSNQENVSDNQKYYIFDFDKKDLLISDFTYLNNKLRLYSLEFKEYLKLIYIPIMEHKDGSLTLKDISGYSFELDRVPLSILTDITDEINQETFKINLNTKFSINEIFNMAQIEVHIESISRFKPEVNIIGDISFMMVNGYSKCIVTDRYNATKRIMNIPEIFFKF